VALALTKMALSIFDNTCCDLGEGVVWIPRRQSIAWLDILSRKLYVKPIHGSVRTVSYDLEYTASAILVNKALSPATLLLVSDVGVFEFNIDTGLSSLKFSYSLPTTHRTNDAGLDPHGHIVFGVMEWEPSGLNGWISRIDLDGNLEILIDSVGIPNTFAWSDDGKVIYFADSFVKTMFQASYFDIGNTRRDLFVLSNSEATPDGSDLAGECLYNAEWGGWRVAKRSLSTGQVLERIQLPISQPTSCVVVGAQIVITTAKTDLSKEALMKSPHSGMTFIANLNDFTMV
jgi:L-arabinonolactonase